MRWMPPPMTTNLAGIVDFLKQIAAKVEHAPLAAG
jgi:hypothetical protein